MVCWQGLGFQVSHGESTDILEPSDGTIQVGLFNLDLVSRMGQKGRKRLGTGDALDQRW